MRADAAFHGFVSVFDATLCWNAPAACGFLLFTAFHCCCLTVHIANGSADLPRATQQHNQEEDVG